MKPTKEQLQAELKALTERINAYQDEPEYNKWYTGADGKSICYAVEPDMDNWFRCYGIDIEGKWFNTGQTPWNDKRPAPDKEVEEALIKEAKKRGFKENFGVQFIGVQFNCKDYLGSEYIITENGLLKFYPESNELALGHGVIMRNGQWAEIISEPKIMIGGYEVVCTENDGFKIGCKNICRTEIKFFQEFMIRYNFTKTSFDGVEVSLETINQILAKL